MLYFLCLFLLDTWHLARPEEDDYTDFWNDRRNVSVTEKDNSATIEHKFKIDQPGNYRLKVSASDLAGRSKVD